MPRACRCCSTSIIRTIGPTATSRSRPAAWAKLDTDGAGQGAARLHARHSGAARPRRRDAGDGPGRQRDQPRAAGRHGSETADRLGAQRRNCSTRASRRCAKRAAGSLAPRHHAPHRPARESSSPGSTTRPRPGVTGLRPDRRQLLPQMVELVDLAQLERDRCRGQGALRQGRDPGRDRLSVHLEGEPIPRPICSARTRCPRLSGDARGPAQVSDRRHPDRRSTPAASASSIGSPPGSRPAAGRAGARARTGRMRPGSTISAPRRCRYSNGCGTPTRGRRRRRRQPPPRASAGASSPPGCVERDQDRNDPGRRRG